MNLNKSNKIKECSSVKNCFIELSKKKLNQKEKQALIFLAKNSENKSLTKIAKHFSLSIGCAESTAWSVLRQLRSIKLIDYNEKNPVLNLTAAAKFLLKRGLI